MRALSFEDHRQHDIVPYQTNSLGKCKCNFRNQERTFLIRGIMYQLFTKLFRYVLFLHLTSIAFSLSFYFPASLKPLPPAIISG